MDIGELAMVQGLRRRQWASMLVLSQCGGGGGSLSIEALYRWVAQSSSWGSTTALTENPLLSPSASQQQQQRRRPGGNWSPSDNELRASLMTLLCCWGSGSEHVWPSVTTSSPLLQCLLSAAFLPTTLEAYRVLTVELLRWIVVSSLSTSPSSMATKASAVQRTAIARAVMHQLQSSLNAEKEHHRGRRSKNNNNGSGGGGGCTALRFTQAESAALVNLLAVCILPDNVVLSLRGGTTNKNQRMQQHQLNRSGVEVREDLLKEESGIEGDGGVGVPLMPLPDLLDWLWTIPNTSPARCSLVNVAVCRLVGKLAATAMPVVEEGADGGGSPAASRRLLAVATSGPCLALVTRLAVVVSTAHLHDNATWQQWRASLKLTANGDDFGATHCIRPPTLVMDRVSELTTVLTALWVLVSGSESARAVLKRQRLKQQQQSSTPFEGIVSVVGSGSNKNPEGEEAAAVAACTLREKLLPTLEPLTEYQLVRALQRGMSAGEEAEGEGGGFVAMVPVDGNEATASSHDGELRQLEHLRRLSRAIGALRQQL